MTQMIKYRVLVIFVAIVASIMPRLLYAHGVRSIVDQGGIVVIAQYDNGEPMSYARVEISAPGARLTFQSGGTDRNGRFCFFPDTPGDWKVVVDDEMGHRLEVIVPVNEAMQLKTNQKAGGPLLRSFSRYTGVILGISVIFGIFGSLSGWMSHKKLRDTRKLNRKE